MDPGLTVRVGVGWNPLDRGGLGTPRFFAAIDALEELGYDSIWLSDTATGAGCAPLPLLAAIAARTTELKLGTSVLVVPPRQPMLLAKELATLDLISNGRLFPAFGLGIDDRAELGALGVDRKERAARLEEAMVVIGELWRGEPVTYHGRFTTLDGVTLSPKPTRERLEIWLSGSSPASLRRTGRLGYGWLASRIGPAAFEQGVHAIRAAAAEAGRTVPEDHYGMVVLAAPTPADAMSLEAARGFNRNPASLREVLGVGVDGVRSMLERFRAAGATKFVLLPVAREPIPWLMRLKTEVIEDFETPAPRPANQPSSSSG